VGELLTPQFLLFAGNKVLRIFAILAIAAFAQRFSGVVVDRVFMPPAGAKKFYLEEKRARTLSVLLKTILRYTVYFIATVMLLQEFNIDTTSIIAGAGIIGLAVGVGAQSLVKDVITGFFIIFEDQYAVGDYIVSDNMSGTVEEISFRTTKLRDSNGVMHIIPNGAIARVSNYTRGHMQAVINIPVAYEADIGKVLLLLEEACREVRKVMPEVLDGPEVIGVVDMRPGEVIVRVVAKTVPLQQVKVETAFRHKAKLLFDAAQIPAPSAAPVTRPER
jgi:small conductance mechanosensitive channel